MAKKYPDGSVSALCSAAIALFALLIAFLGYTSFKSSDPWSWPDLFVQIIPAILAGGALASVPFFATQERKGKLVAESVRIARRMFTLGSCLVAFVIFTWFIRDFIAHHEQEPTDKEIRQLIEKYHTALLQRDIPMLEKIWADDYAFVNAVGDVLTKAQRLANIKSGRTTFESLNDEEDITVRVYQNSAVATSRLIIKGQYGGQPTSGQYRSSHVWVKGPAGWQLVSNQLTALAPK